MSSSENPYAPPEAALADVTEQVVYPAAGGGQRLLNYFLDQLGTGASMYVFMIAVAILGTATGIDTTDFLESENKIFDWLFGYLFAVIYYTVLEGTMGRSLGKWITGTRAVMDDGSPLTFFAAFMRSLCRLIPFEAFSFLGNRASGWHDTLTGTMVVNLRAEARPRHQPVRSMRALPPQAPVARTFAAPTVPAPRPIPPKPMPPVPVPGSRETPQKDDPAGA